jgi:predicted AlkP superfamily pyrophosphatase or phosphodiesterase
MRRRLLAALLLLALAATSHAAATTPGRPPKLVVILVVDQMRADYIDRFGHQWSRGLRRLIDQGAWFRLAAYPYANTVTCVGHSTIATGSLPATHGIVANSWWDRSAGRVVACTEDPRETVVSYGGAIKGGNSVANLLVPTFSDELRAEMPVAPHVVTFSMKDYTAVTLAGHHADAATWFNAGAHAFATSSAFSRTPVPFVAGFIRAHPIEADLDKVWTPMLPASAYLYEDAAAGERPPAFWSRSFPHPLRRADGRSEEDAYSAWEESPFSDAYLGRMAAAAVDALGLGKGRGTDYLAISFSALDLVGHDFGPHSHEVQDVLVRLDATIGELLAHLDRTVGPAGYVVALAADHGVAPIPEERAAQGLDAGRILTSDLVDRLEKALEAALGPGRHVSRMMAGEVYLAPGVMEKIEANPAAMRAALDEVRRTPGVLDVLRGDELRERRTSGDPIVRAIALGYWPARSGDLVVLARPYWFFVAGQGASPGAASTHGSPNQYDQRVPLILMGAGIRQGEYFQPASPADIAPTLAFLCGITLSRPDGRVLTEAIAQK